MSKFAGQSEKSAGRQVRAAAGCREVHAEGHVAGAATVFVTDVGAYDVAPGPAELHLATDQRARCADRHREWRPRATRFDAALDGKELLAVLMPTLMVRG